MAKKAQKPKEKVYKAGTKIVLHSTCNYAGCEDQEEIELDADTTESELQEMASDFARETVQAEGWFEEAEEDEES